MKAANDPLADLSVAVDHAAMNGNHWTYAEWEENTVEKIVTMGLSAPAEHRADYLRVQIRAAVR